MTTSIYPVEILNILDELKSESFEDVLGAVTDERDRQLTKSLCCSDACDFIVMVEQDAFLLVSNDQTGEWTAHHVGQPIYEVEPEMIGDDEVDLDEFIKELQHELKGVEIKRGSALNNAKSEFVQWFKSTLDRAFAIALESC